jgi:acetyltransferase
MTVRIQRFSARRLGEQRQGLVGLLVDTVDAGAAVGFLAPLPQEVAESYWRDVERELGHGHRELLVAERDGAVVGAVQLELAEQPNARHRAAVAKLLVHSSAQRQGIARTLMREVEELARSHGRTLLVLDTREGEAGEALYLSLGYIRAGRIPGYARSSSGGRHATVLFYRELPSLAG